MPCHLAEGLREVRVGPQGAAIHLALTTPDAFLRVIAFEPPLQGLIKVDGTFA
jgi:hypothetical protein